MQLTVREASRLLNVPERAIYRWIQEGSIPAQRIGELFAWISPSVRVGLQLVTRSTWMLGDRQLADVLARRSGREQVVEVVRALESRSALAGPHPQPG